MPRLSQETIALIGVLVAVIGVGVALGALILTTTGGLREEIQAIRAEARADREAFERRMAADREAFERRMAADREASERHRADFQKQIIRLTEQQGTLGGLVEGLRHHRQLTATGSNDPPG